VIESAAGALIPFRSRGVDSRSVSSPRGSAPDRAHATGRRSPARKAGNADKHERQIFAPGSQAFSARPSPPKKAWVVDLPVTARSSEGGPTTFFRVRLRRRPAEGRGAAKRRGKKKNSDERGGRKLPPPRSESRAQSSTGRGVPANDIPSPGPSMYLPSAPRGGPAQNTVEGGSIASPVLAESSEPRGQAAPKGRNATRDRQDSGRLLVREPGAQQPVRGG